MVLLAAVWGSSFLFTRIAAPMLGPAVLIEYRLVFAALFLAVVGVFLKQRLDLRANWRHYFTLDFFNSALPFLLFAYAPFANVHGSMWASTLLVIPALAFFPAPGAPTFGAMAATLALGVVCTGMAYIVYFKLIEDVGTTSALTVTFFNPIFGILWGALFLGEIVGWYTVAGAGIVILGTALVTGFTPRSGAPASAPDGKFDTK